MPTIITNVHGQLYAYNSAFSELSGFSLEEIPHIKNIEQLLPEQNWEEILHVANDTSSVNHEIKDVLLLDAHGKPHFIDIFLRSRPKQQITIIQIYRYSKSARSWKDFEDLFTHLRQGLIHFDRSGKIQFSNNVFKNFCHLPPESVDKTNVKDLGLFPQRHLKRIFTILEQNGQIRNYTCLINPDTDTPMQIRLDARSVIGDDGSLRYYEAVIQNSAIQNELEQQLFQAQKLEAVGRLTSGIAHDFKNILSAIIGYAQLLQMDKIISQNEESGSNVKHVIQMADRGVTLVKKLLNFSRRNVRGVQSCMVNEVITDVIEMLQFTTSKELTFDVAIEDHLPPVAVDPVDLQQILMNLSMNAWDAMGVTGNSGVLHVGAEYKQLSESLNCFPIPVDPGKYVKITVEDNGMGMTDETLRHIFEPFYTTKDEGIGTGLGLSISRRIIEDFQGGLRVKSIVGTGTTFHIFLPVDDHKIDQVSEPPGQEKYPTDLEYCYNILVVDDEEHIRLMESRFLELCGQNVITASGGAEAIDICSYLGDNIDLVLLDMKMPEVSGLDFLRTIRQQDHNLPVLIITGYISADEIAECQKLGIDGLLEKPFTFDQLVKLLHKYLHAKLSKHQIKT